MNIQWLSCRNIDSVSVCVENWWWHSWAEYAAVIVYVLKEKEIFYSLNKEMAKLCFTAAHIKVLRQDVTLEYDHYFIDVSA